MKIRYNQKEKSIEVDDGLSSHYFVLKFLIILNLINAVLFSWKWYGNGLWGILWIFMGVSTLVILLVFVFRLTTKEKIPIEKISKLRDRKFFGRTRISLMLNNGRIRHIATRGPRDVLEAYQVIDQSGVNK